MNVRGSLSREESIALMRASLDSAQTNLSAAIELVEAKIIDQRPQVPHENNDPTGLSRPPHAEAHR
jgi:hypothetical protein